jgi:hypothetical protein
MRRNLRVCFLACLALYLLVGGWRATMVSAHLPDPEDPGPHDVTREEYNFGDMAFTSTDFAVLVPSGRVEVLTSVHYTTDLSAGPFPWSFSSTAATPLSWEQPHYTCTNSP